MEQSEATKAELLHEVQILATLRHPDLVAFMGACLDEAPLMLITEFVSGGDLERYYMAKRSELRTIFRPRLGQLLQWSLCVARALCYLHQFRPPIIHRDLKPLNLLLTDDLKRLKLLDF